MASRLAGPIFPQPMKPKPTGDPAALRHAAEARLKEQPASHPAKSETDLRRLQHELEVHQIELEMQNEELRAARDKITDDLERFTELYDFAPVGYVSLCPEGTILRLNLLGATLAGLERGRLVGRRFGLFLAEADRGMFRDFLERVMASEVKEHCEVRLSQEGTVPRVLQIEGMQSQDGQECRAVLLDITARRQVEAALRQSEEDFRSMAESMPQIVWVTRPDGGNIYFNQQWVDYTGLTQAESRGHGWHTPFHPDDKQRAREAWQQATQHNATYSLECRLRRADGAYRWWLVRGVPVARRERRDSQVVWHLHGH